MALPAILPLLLIGGGLAIVSSSGRKKPSSRKTASCDALQKLYLSGQQVGGGVLQGAQREIEKTVSQFPYSGSASGSAKTIEVYIEDLGNCVWAEDGKPIGIFTKTIVDSPNFPKILQYAQITYQRLCGKAPPSVQLEQMTKQEFLYENEDTPREFDCPQTVTNPEVIPASFTKGARFTSGSQKEQEAFGWLARAAAIALFGDEKLSYLSAGDSIGAFPMGLSKEVTASYVNEQSTPTQNTTRIASGSVDFLENPNKAIDQEVNAFAKRLQEFYFGTNDLSTPVGGDRLVTEIIAIGSRRFWVEKYGKTTSEIWQSASGPYKVPGDGNIRDWLTSQFVWARGFNPRLVQLNKESTSYYANTMEGMIQPVSGWSKESYAVNADPGTPFHTLRYFVRYNDVALQAAVNSGAQFIANGQARNLDDGARKGLLASSFQNGFGVPTDIENILDDLYKDPLRFVLVSDPVKRDALENASIQNEPYIYELWQRIRTEIAEQFPQLAFG